jgi:hypothetical protein
MMWWDASTVRALRGNASVLTHRVRMTSGARMSTDAPAHVPRECLSKGSIAGQFVAKHAPRTAHLRGSAPVRSVLRCPPLVLGPRAFLPARAFFRH